MVGLISIVLAFGGGFYLYQSLGSSIKATLARSLVKRAGRVSAQLSNGQIIRSDSSRLVVSKDEALVQIFSMNHRLLYASASAGSHSLVSQSILSRTAVSGVVTLNEKVPSSRQNSELMHLSVTGLANGDRVILLVGTSMDQLVDSSVHMFKVLAVGIPLVVLALTLGSWVLAGMALRPVEDLRVEAEGLLKAQSAGTLMVPPTGDGLEALGNTLNSLLDNAEAAMSKQRLFVAAASHELRSPLAALAASLEAVAMRAQTVDEMKRAVSQSLTKVDELIKLANDLLILASGDEHPLELKLEKCNLDALVASVLEDHRFSADRAKVDLMLDVDPDICIQVDVRSFSMAISNIVDNSLRFAPAGSVIRISGREVNQWIYIEIQDEGPGVPDEFIARAFDRFSRADGQVRDRHKGGAGLGLAIVQMILENHGASASISNSDSGGAIVSIRIGKAVTLSSD